MRRSRFLLQEEEGNKANVSNLFTIMQKQRNQFIKANKMQKETTANYRHTESLNYFYFKDEASHTHTPQINKERKQKKKGTSLASSAGVVRVPSARPLPRTCPLKQKDDDDEPASPPGSTRRRLNEAPLDRATSLSPNPNRLSSLSETPLYFACTQKAPRTPSWLLHDPNSKLNRARPACPHAVLMPQTPPP